MNWRWWLGPSSIDLGGRVFEGLGVYIAQSDQFDQVGHLLRLADVGAAASAGGDARDVHFGVGRLGREHGR